MASKETEEAVKEATESPEEVIEPESDSDNFEDASDNTADDGGTHDFDRPEEWGESVSEYVPDTLESGVRIKSG